MPTMPTMRTMPTMPTASAASPANLRTITSALALAAALLAAPAALAQADHCTSATPILASVVYHGNNISATSDIAQTCSTADSYDVWYTFTATLPGEHSIDTFYSTLDTTLSVFASCGGAMLDCNDDVDFANGDYTSLVVVTLTTGQNIKIRVAGYSLDRDIFELFITPPSVTLPTGACCRGSTCTSGLATDCTGTGTSYAGDNTACNAPGNNVTPCCKADFNRSGGLEVQDIFDYINAWFAHNSGADFNGGGLSVQDIFDYLNAWFAGC